MPFKRTTYTFESLGINICAPIDRLPDGKYRLLKNVRRYGTDRLVQRQGTVSVNAGSLPGLPITSIYQLNDPVPSPASLPGAYSKHARFLGIGTQLWSAQDNITPASFGLVESGFSGFPFSFVAVSSDFTPRPWVLIGDSVKMRKDSSAVGKQSAIGIPPPNFAPTIAISTANANGPDVGATGQPYVYRFQARLSSTISTGAKSNMGPPVRTKNGLSPSSVTLTPVPSNITVTAPQAHPDTNVRWLDVYRFGGAVPSWRYIGTMSNVIGSSLEDTFNDLQIESSPEGEFNDNQPFATIDSSKSGNATLTALGTGLGATLTITGGDHFRNYNTATDNPYYPAGTEISVDGNFYTFYRSPDTATTVELLEDPPAGAVGGDYVLNTPEMWRQALPYFWGPYGGGSTGIFVFACGDPINAGTCYWTKGNHPESHPGTNSLVLTSANEPLMNGVLYNGNSFVFSNQRMFQFYPTLGQTTDFIALEVPNSKGLYAHWGLCVTPWGIVFINRDGIYLTSGGAPVSLTDEDLYGFFPHEGDSIPSAFANTDGLLDATFPRPDMTIPQLFRLAFGDNYLYFDFPAQDGRQYTLVGEFDATGKFVGWISLDLHEQGNVQCRYFESLASDQDAVMHYHLVIGTQIGQFLEYAGAQDLGHPINGQIRTGSKDFGDPRPRKFIGDIELDTDTECDTINIQVGFDNFTYLSALATSGMNLTGRRRSIADINAGFGQYAYNVGLDITWANASDSAPIFFFWAPAWVDKPEVTALRVTDWDDCGYKGAKFLQGFKLRADTLGLTRSVDVLFDGGVPGGVQTQSFSVLHETERVIAYTFDTPFIAHLVRFHPTDAKFWRIEGVEWIWEPAPELVTTWITQETTHDMEGWFYFRDAYIPVISTAPVTMAITINGNPASPFTYTVPSTAGLYLKNYLILQAMKAKAVSYSLTSPDGFRLFQKDAEIRAKSWGTPGPFQSFRPFGDQSRAYGARI